MIFGDLTSWFFILTNFIVFHFNMMIFHDIWWFFVTFNDFWWFWWLVMIYHDWSWQIIIQLGEVTCFQTAIPSHPSLKELRECHISNHPESWLWNRTISHYFHMITSWCLSHNELFPIVWLLITNNSSKTTHFCDTVQTL